MPLDVQAVSYTDHYIEFSSPVRVNGEDSFLRFIWMTNKEHRGEGHYEFLGIWNGVDHVSGLAGRYLGNLEEGDKIEVLSLHGAKTRGSITVEGDIELTEMPMEAGEYECFFVAKDLFGREYCSEVCRYFVDESGNVVARMREESERHERRIS